MRLGRRRTFTDLLERQLDLFVAEHAALMAACDSALQAYDAARAEEAEERYGDYVDLLDAVRDELEQLRDAYAATLDAGAAETYEAAFAREVRRRFPRYVLELE